MKEFDISDIQVEIEEIRDDFMNKSLEFIEEVPPFNRKQLAYSKNRDIVAVKLQEALMWLENMKTFGKEF